jgi:hypothetical protein
MRQKIIDKISDKTGINEYTVRAVLSELGRGIFEELRAGEKHRIVITNFLSLAAHGSYVNYKIKENLIGAMRYAKIKDPDAYEAMKLVFRRLWAIKQDHYRYQQRMNFGYRPTKK